jgi:hypothetical protein
MTAGGDPAALGQLLADHPDQTLVTYSLVTGS